MKTYKSIERKSLILGMPIGDLMLLLALLIALVLLGSIGSIFFPVSKFYYLSTVGMVLLLYLAMKFINRRKHPNFLVAALSFHVRQPGVIQPFNPADFNHRPYVKPCKDA
jgi:threonine/homoserine/homoserine lactone efflux protein